MLGHLLRASVYSREAIDPEDWKHRNTVRVWLPLYDLLAVGAGVWATWWGSPLLRRIFPDGAIDGAGIALALAGAVCLCGVLFPMLWPIEMIGKTVLAGLIAAYAATVAIFQAQSDPGVIFVVFMLLLGLIPPIERMGVLGEEWKERRAAGGRDSTEEHR